jgi:group I intron endonuclease
MSYQNAKIYKIVNDVNDIIYIGSTKNKLCKRMTDHRADAKSRTTPFYTAMREIGIHHFRIILIKPFPCSSSEELTAEEYRVMKEMKREGVLLYNDFVGCHSKESKQKMSEAHKGKTHSEETKQKMSEVHKGLIVGENNPNFGKFGKNNPKFSYGNICYDTSNKAWIFQWKDSGKRKVKTFSLKRYGDLAKLHAENYRKVIYPESVDESQYVEIIFLD